MRSRIKIFAAAAVISAGSLPAIAGESLGARIGAGVATLHLTPRVVRANLGGDGGKLSQILIELRESRLLLAAIRDATGDANALASLASQIEEISASERRLSSDTWFYQGHRRGHAELDGTYFGRTANSPVIDALLLQAETLKAALQTQAQTAKAAAAQAQAEARSQAVRQAHAKLVELQSTQAQIAAAISSSQAMIRERRAQLKDLNENRKLLANNVRANAEATQAAQRRQSQASQDLQRMQAELRTREEQRSPEILKAFEYSKDCVVYQTVSVYSEMGVASVQDRLGRGTCEQTERILEREAIAIRQEVLKKEDILRAVRATRFVDCPSAPEGESMADIGLGDRSCEALNRTAVAARVAAAEADLRLTKGALSNVIQLQNFVNESKVSHEALVRQGDETRDQYLSRVRAVETQINGAIDSLRRSGVDARLAEAAEATKNAERDANERLLTIDGAARSVQNEINELGRSLAELGQKNEAALREITAHYRENRALVPPRRAPAK